MPIWRSEPTKSRLPPRSQERAKTTGPTFTHSVVIIVETRNKPNDQEKLLDNQQECEIATISPVKFSSHARPARRV